MAKKLFAFVMVAGIMGGILAGCSAPAEGEKKDAPAATAGGTGTTSTETETK